jgi:hypothetical protein
MRDIGPDVDPVLNVDFVSKGSESFVACRRYAALAHKCRNDVGYRLIA